MDTDSVIIILSRPSHIRERNSYDPLEQDILQVCFGFAKIFEYLLCQRQPGVKLRSEYLYEMETIFENTLTMCQSED